MISPHEEDSAYTSANHGVNYLAAIFWPSQFAAVYIFESPSPPQSILPYWPLGPYLVSMQWPNWFVLPIAPKRVVVVK